MSVTAAVLVALVALVLTMALTTAAFSGGRGDTRA
jgi:hypothetical protein